MRIEGIEWMTRYAEASRLAMSRSETCSARCHPEEPQATRDLLRGPCGRPRHAHSRSLAAARDDRVSGFAAVVLAGLRHHDPFQNGERFPRTRDVLGLLEQPHFGVRSSEANLGPELIANYRHDPSP